METARIPTTKDETFRQQLDELYRENFQLMYRVAKSVTGNRYDAEDAVQNVFVKLIQGQPSSNFQKNPKAYLCKAAMNEARNIVRSCRLRREVEADMSELDIAADGDKDKLRERLIAALSELDPHLVAMLTLRFEQGYSCKEIAEELGRTNLGVRLNLHRVLRKLGKLMSDPGGIQ